MFLTNSYYKNLMELNIHHSECHVFLDMFTLAHHSLGLDRKQTFILFLGKTAEDLEEDSSLVD